MPTSYSSPKHNLPLTWALSGMIFVSVLESCRVTSPTTALWNAVQTSPNSDHLGDEARVHQGYDDDDDDEDDDYYKTALVAIGDYTLGGSVAGAAGALGSQRRTSASGSILRPPSVAWGLGMGLALGCVAGILQAGIEVGNLYLSRQQQRQQQ